MSESPAVSPLRSPFPLGPRAAFALAAASGLLYFACFPGPSLWLGAFVCQAPLLLALRGQTPRRAVELGLTAGVFFSATVFQWLLGTIRVFGGFSLPVASVVMALLCVYQGGRTAMLGWLYARAEARGYPAPLAFSAAFVASELLYPLLFPWYLSVGVHNAAPFMQVAELGGPYAVALTLLGANLALAEGVSALLEKRRPCLRTLGIGLSVTALSGLYGLVRIGQVEARMAEAPKLNVGIAQGNQPLIDRSRSVRTHARLTAKLREEHAELVVWPEGAVGGAWDAGTLEDAWRLELGPKLGGAAIVGATVADYSTDPARRFNSAIFSDEDGVVQGRYDKQLLLPFGEYIPFGQAFPAIYKLSPHSGRLSPGAGNAPLTWRGHRLGVLICYEDILPSFVNRLVRETNPDILINLTNDAWFGKSIEPWEHLGLAQLRAVEHRRYLVRSTNTGASAIVDAAGRVTKHGGLFEEEAIAGETRLLRSTTVYEVIGDAPAWAIAALSFAMAFRPRRRRAAA